VGCNTRTLWNAHSTQRHRGTEIQREELNIELKKSNRIARIIRIDRIKQQDNGLLKQYSAVAEDHYPVVLSCLS
jgi:hypothetical protein